MQSTDDVSQGDVRPRRRRSARRAEVAARQHTAMTLRRSGATLKQIAEHLHVSEMQVHRDIKAAIALTIERTRAAAEEHIALEVVRLDGLLLGVWRRATDGDPQAVIAALRVCESRRRLLGLDAEAYIGLLLPGAPGEDLAAVPLPQLQARLTRAFGALAAAPPPSGPPTIDVRALEPVGVPLPPPADDRESRLAAYERELAQRRNGRPH